jgi:hypothetical protein
MKNKYNVIYYVIHFKYIFEFFHIFSYFKFKEWSKLVLKKLNVKYLETEEVHEKLIYTG